MTELERTDVGALVARIAELERERAQLRESEHRLRTVLEALPVGVWFTDGSGRIELGNAAAQRIWGGARYVGVEEYGAYRGWWADTGEPIGAEEWALARALRGETSLDEVVDIACFDGSRKTILNSGVPVRDERGATVGAVVINVDVTAHKRTERRLEEALQRLRSHTENSPLAVVEWSADFRVTAWNAAAERMFGWSAAEVVGKRIDELGLVHPGDAASVRAVSADMMSGARPSNVNANRNLRRDGAVIACEWYNSALHDAAGRLVSVLSLVLDVTARNRAQAEAASVARFPLENPDPVLRIDADGMVSFANGAALESFGALPLAPGRPAPAAFGEPAARARAGGARVIADVASGDRTFAASFVPVAHGELNVYAHDVTGRERAREERERVLAELRAAKEELEESDRRKSEFLAVLSHELRNPLAPIRNAVHILRAAAPASAQAGRARAVLERQVDHLARLVDDLLDVTRVARGKIELRRAPLDVIAAVRHAAEDHRPLLDGHGVALALELPDRPVLVEGDATRLAQATGNLLQNAAKFTPRGGRVTVAARAAGGLVELRVSDTGEGMEAELLERIFTPFVQAERSLARTRGGLGLGLALVKALVELHGGTVRAESPGPGLGSTFVVTLPALPGPA